MCELIIKKEMTTVRIKNKKSLAKTMENSRIDPPVEKMWTTVLEKAVGWLPTIFSTGSIFLRSGSYPPFSARPSCWNIFYLEEKKRKYFENKIK